jgi:hypothetical protein
MGRPKKPPGSCVRCQNPAALYAAVCGPCADKMAADKQAARDRGDCVVCWHAPALPQHRMCATCNARAKHHNQERYKARAARHLCVRCGKAPQWHGRTTCMVCWRKAVQKRTVVSRKKAITSSGEVRD